MGFAQGESPHRRITRCRGFCRVVAGEEIADMEIDFCCPVGGADAETPTGRFDEPSESGQVKVVSSFDPGDVALGHTEGVRHLVLGEPDSAANLSNGGVLGCEPVFNLGH